MKNNMLIKIERMIGNKIDFTCLFAYLLLIIVGTLLNLTSINPLWLGFVNIIVFLFPVYYLIGRMVIKLWSTETMMTLAGNKLFMVSILVPIVILALFIIGFNSRERYVYFWDFSGYWTTTISYTDMWFNSPFHAIGKIYASIIRDEYNVVPQVPLVLFFKLLGTTFPIFTLSIYISFVVPFFILTSSLLLRLISDYYHELSSRIAFVVIYTIALVTSIIQPVLSGYLDSAGLMVCTFIISAVYLKETKKMRHITYYITLVFFLIGLAFIRRWYAYWIVGFFVAYGITLLYKAMISNPQDRKEAWRSIRDIFILGISSIIVLLIGFKEFFVRSLYTNYKDIYSAYQSGDLFHNLILLKDNFGWFVWALVFIGAIGTWVKFKQLRILILGLVSQIAISFYLFVRVQTMGQQHYYILVPSIVILIGLSVLVILSASKKKWYKISIGSIILLLSIGNFAHSFIEQPIPLLQRFNAIYTKNQEYPRMRTDLNQLRLISSYLNEVSGKTKGIYVVSSSFIFNDDILRKLDMPDNLNPIPTLNGASHVDKRDGLPKDFLKSDIVVVADPIQYHLNPNDQRVVGELAKPFLENTGIAKSYKLMKTYTIDENIKIRIYKKQKDVDKNSLNELENKFQQWYPELKNKFKFEN